MGKLHYVHKQLYIVVRLARMVVFYKTDCVLYSTYSLNIIEYKSLCK